MANLFTSHEDASLGHLHAIVGFLNLFIYAWRFSLLAKGDDQMGFGQDLPLDAFSVACMLMPNLTSFVFQKHVKLENRHGTNLIWKEYRWHNSIFIVQSTLLLSVNIYQLHFGKMDSRVLFWGKVALTAIRLVCMKLATEWNPPGSRTTIRGTFSDAPVIVAWGLSYAQFVATSIVLCWEISTSMHFGAVFGMQLHTFFLTLRRKGKIGDFFYLTNYVVLVCIFVYKAFLPPFMEEPIHSLLDPRFKPFYMGLFTFWVRCQGLNRFATWFIGPVTTELVFRALTQLVETSTS